MSVLMLEAFMPVGLVVGNAAASRRAPAAMNWSYIAKLVFDASL